MAYNNPTEFQRNDRHDRKKIAKAGDLCVGKILIVDDEIDTVGVLHNFLEENGFTVTSSLSAGKALDLLRTHSFDLLITDLDMPEMDGIELLNAASEVDPDLIGIIMTGHGSIETAVDAMKAGAFDYLLKPFKFQMLLPICSRAMRVRKLSRSERRHRMLVDELTLMVKKMDNSAKQPEVRELEIVELKEEIEGLKTELTNYKTMENQWMFYDA
jgi:DNA-binding NtrC family response regulator